MDARQSSIRILLVDDHETIHQEIADLISSFADIELVAQGRNGLEAVDICDRMQIDVVLMDISMPVMNGIESTAAILARHPAVHILAMSGMDDRGTVQKMLAAGAAGYVLKDASPEQLESAIRTVFAGQAVFSTRVMKPLLASSSTAARTPRDFDLTRRELEILQAMALGLNNQEVAEKLFISTATVRFHLTHIIRKLGAENRTEALIIAIREKLI